MIFGFIYPSGRRFKLPAGRALPASIGYMFSIYLNTMGFYY